MADSARRIVIIGAGWTGIGALRVLRDAGHAVRVFEALDDVGGVWHPSNTYAGFQIHSPSLQIEYPDHPLPEAIDRASRISARRVFDYVKSYCRRFDLEQHIRFGARVVRVDHRSDGTVALTLGTGETEVFDHCVCTVGYTRPRIPDFPGRGDFGGELIHLFEASTERLEAAMADGRRIGVIGGSKAAVDLIGHFARAGHRVDWFYRAPYWFLDFDRLQRETRARVARGRAGWGRASWALGLGMVLGGRWPRFVFWMWRLLGLIHTYGRPRPGFEKFHFGLVGARDMAPLREATSRAQRVPAVRFAKDGVEGADGQVRPLDLVICCTGSGEGVPRFEVCLDGVPIDMAAEERVYIGRAVPRLPRLVFTAYHAFSFGTVNGLSYGRWIARYIEADAAPETLDRFARSHRGGFFGRPVLFDTSRPMLPVMQGVLDDLYRAGYITRLAHGRWMVGQVFLSHAPSQPMTFDRPHH